MSDSTPTYERGDKFAADRTIATFQEYVLVDQYSAHVEHYVKTGSKQWMLQAYDSLETTLSLASLGLDIAMLDIYNKVQFEPAEQAEEA